MKARPQRRSPGGFFFSKLSARVSHLSYQQLLSYSAYRGFSWYSTFTVSVGVLKITEGWKLQYSRSKKWIFKFCSFGLDFCIEKKKKKGLNHSPVLLLTCMVQVSWSFVTIQTGCLHESPERCAIWSRSSPPSTASLSGSRSPYRKCWVRWLIFFFNSWVRESNVFRFPLGFRDEKCVHLIQFVPQ